MAYDAHTFNVCGEILSEWQDILMLRLALQPIVDLSPIARQSAAVSRILVAEDFTAKPFMKSVGDRSATVQQPVSY